MGYYKGYYEGYYKSWWPRLSRLGRRGRSVASALCHCLGFRV